MSAARGSRLALVRMIAARLALRDRPPRPAVRRVLVASAVITGAATLALLFVSSMWLVAVCGVGGMTLLCSICLRVFPTAMAVSVIGIALSCASLLTVLAVTTGFEREILRAVARVNGHVLLSKYGLDFFEYEVISDRWLADPRVTAASPFAFSMVAVVKTSREGGTRLSDDEALLADVPDTVDDGEPELGPSIVVGKGVDPERAAALEGIHDVFARGDLGALRPADTRHRPGIVLGDALAREIGVEVGDHVRVVVPAEIDGHDDPGVLREPRHATFVLLDTLHTGTSELDRNLALVHLTAGQALFFREGRVTGIEFQLVDPDVAETVAQEMQDAMGYPYRTSTWREANDSLLAGIDEIRIALSLILGLMVLVAASSLIASLLLIVRRKKHDIAVILAVGGDPSLVFWIFESVGLLAGVAGAALGIGLGGLYCFVLYTFEYPLGGEIYPVDHLPVLVSAMDALGPAFVAVLLCSIASGPVAVLASKTRLVAGLGR
jgi:lipoprotein-releasing system permease protein